MVGIGLVREAVGMVRVGMLSVDMVGGMMGTCAGGRSAAITDVGTTRIVVQVLVLAVTRRLPASGDAVASEVPPAADAAWGGGLLALGGLALDLATAAFAEGRRARNGHGAVGHARLGHTMKDAAMTTTTEWQPQSETATATTSTHTLQSVGMLVVRVSVIGRPVLIEHARRP